MTEPQFSTWSGMPGRFDVAWQRLYDVNVGASARDEQDLVTVMAKLEEEYNDLLTTSTDEENAVQARFQELKDQQRASWDALWAYWQTEFKADVANTTTLYDAAMVWKEDVPSQLGEHEATIQSSTARMEWTGPGATAYGEKLPDQVQAMGDLKQHVQTVGYGVEQGAFVLGGIYTSILNDVEGLADAIEELAGDASGETFGVRVYNARLWMDDSLELLQEYRSGVGLYDGDVADANAAMTDSVADAAVLNGPRWPVASSESIQDMQPGTPENPPPTIPPGGADPNPEPGPQATNPDTGTPTETTPEDPSNLDRTNTSDVGDEGND